MESIHQQFEKTGITPDEIKTAIKFTKDIISEYHENVKDMNNMLDILHKSKKNRYITFGTDDVIDAQTKVLNEQRDKYLLENEISIIQLTSFLEKLKILNELL